MMIHRLTGALLWTLVLVLLSLSLAACSTGTGSTSPSPSPSPASSSPAAGALAPSPPRRSLARTDLAVWAAVRFEQTHCAWDWRRPLAAYVAVQQALATTTYGTHIAAAADPVSWREEVVAGKQQVTCTVSDPHRLRGASSTSTAAYVRMSVSEQVTSTMGDFAGGDSIASWLVRLVDGRWLVAGTFDGG